MLLIISPQIFLEIGLRADKAVDRSEFALRRNLKAAFFPHFSLFSADSRIQCPQLAVDIARGKHISVDQRDIAHTHTGEHLNGGTAHASETEAQDTGTGKNFHCTVPEKYAGPGIVYHVTKSGFCLFLTSASPEAASATRPSSIRRAVF